MTHLCVRKSFTRMNESLLDKSDIWAQKTLIHVCERLPHERDKSHIWAQKNQKTYVWKTRQVTHVSFDSLTRDWLTPDMCESWHTYRSWLVSFICVTGLVRAQQTLIHMCDWPRAQKTLIHTRERLLGTRPVFWPLPHIQMSHVTHTNESCHWLSHGTHMTESCHTYDWVMSHIWLSHVTHCPYERDIRLVGLFCRSL